jgi:hypothetical protein
MLWGFGATTHWMGPDAALMGADGTLTAAGSRISRPLREEWSTQGDGVTGADGRVAFRGFYGSYEVGCAVRAAARSCRKSRRPAAGIFQRIQFSA